MKRLTFLIVLLTATASSATTVVIDAIGDTDTQICGGGYSPPAATYPPPWQFCQDTVLDVYKSAPPPSYDLDVGFIRFITGPVIPADAVIDSASLIFTATECHNVDGFNLTGEWYPDWLVLGSGDFTSSCSSSAFSIPMSSVRSQSNLGGCTLDAGIRQNTIALTNPDAAISKVSGNTAFRLCVDGGQPSGETEVIFSIAANFNNDWPQLSITYHLASPTPGASVTPTITPTRTPVTPSPTATPTPTPTNTVTCFNGTPAVIPWDIQKLSGTAGVNTVAVTVPHDVPTGQGLIVEFPSYHYFGNSPPHTTPISATDTAGNAYHCTATNVALGVAQVNTPLHMAKCYTTTMFDLHTGNTISVIVDDIYATLHVVSAWELVIASGGFPFPPSQQCLDIYRDTGSVSGYTDLGCNIACQISGGICGFGLNATSVDGNGSPFPNPAYGHGTAAIEPWPYGAILACESREFSCPPGWPSCECGQTQCTDSILTTISSCLCVPPGAYCINRNYAGVQFYDPGICTCAQQNASPPICVDPAWKFVTYGMAINHAITNQVDFLHPTGLAGCTDADGSACRPISPRPSSDGVSGGLCTGIPGGPYTCVQPWYVESGEVTPWDTTQREGDATIDVYARTRVVTTQESKRVGFSLPNESGVEWGMEWDYFSQQPVLGQPTLTPTAATPIPTNTQPPIFQPTNTPVPTNTPTMGSHCETFTPTLGPTPTPGGACIYTFLDPTGDLGTTCDYSGGYNFNCQPQPPVSAVFLGDGHRLEIIFSTQPAVTFVGEAITASHGELWGYRIETRDTVMLPTRAYTDLGNGGNTLTITFNEPPPPFALCPYPAGCNQYEQCPFQFYLGKFVLVVSPIVPQPSEYLHPVPEWTPVN